MKYIKCIALISVLFIASCTTELIDPYNLNGNNVVQLASRIIPFSDRDVTTRANKNEVENKISSIDYLVFSADDKCIFHQRVSSTDPLLVDKSSSDFQNVNLSECYIVSIANSPELNITLKSTTWDEISMQSIDVSSVSIASGNFAKNGLPMIGRYPETGTFNFGETNQGTVLTIPMKSLFSKIVVNITVDADEILSGENQPLPTFALTNCTVHNVASKVDFIGGIESDDGSKNVDNQIIIGTDDNVNVNIKEYTLNASGETVDGGSPLSFSFYLPERFLQAGTSPAIFQYPFGKGGAIREQDKDKRQQYKPLLAKGYEAYNSEYDPTKDKKATFVKLEGVFSDHQGHSFPVSYDLYVGNDNYGNFDIVRNTQYNNNVIIRGIKNSSNQSTDLSSVSIDHRVNVKRDEPIIINLRRETLLDSHFEVRPLLIRRNGAYESTIAPNAKVKIEVEYDESTTSNWIGLERSFGNGVIQNNSNTYLVDSELSAGRKNAAGKRKYFTTDLTTNTLSSSDGEFDDNGFSTAGGTTVVVPITEEDQRIWIYIDECTTSGDDVRTATVKVSYDLDGDGDGYSNPVKYVLNQRLLFPVRYVDSANKSHPYNIEYHEEYLYNYDSDDQYGQTEYEGMEWGLDYVQLSYDHDALFFESYLGLDFITGIINSLTESAGVDPKYDFYIPKHDTNVSSKATKRDRMGYTFCEEIISDLKNNERDKDPLNDINKLNLADNPKSAIEYCYNKNKRESDGTISDVKWYLPAIDEIEDVVMSTYGDNQKTYSRFEEFQNKYYWSCQPSYIQNYGYYHIIISYQGAYYYDDVNYARATKVNYENGNYDYERSGTTGYYNGIEIYSENWQTEYKLHTTGSLNNQTLGSINRQPGNLHRKNDKARIRCIYKEN